MFARFTRLFGRTFAPPSERRPRFRPRVEELDGRIVPSVDIYLGGDPYTASNWSAGHYPTYGDDVYLDGNYSSGDVPLSAIGPLAGIHLVNGYSGTVTLTNHVWVGTLELTSGAISQWNGSFSTNMTVSSSLNWTGGTLNSSVHAGTVHFTGTTATIDPTAGVTTGSNLSFENGVTATVEPGTITFNNDTIYTISDLSTVVFNATSTITLVQNANAPNPNANNGNQIIQGGKDVKVGGPIVNTKTVQIIGTGTVAVFNGAVTAYTQSAAGASTTIQDGAGMDVSAGGVVKIAGGTLRTITNAGVTDSYANVWGTFVWTGGDLYIRVDTGQPQAVPGLFVHGNATWSGGTFHVYVDAQDGDNVDELAISGYLQVDTTGAVKPSIVTTTVGGVPPSITIWRPIWTGNGSFINGALPSVTATDGVNYELSVTQSHWRLKKA